MKIREGAYYRTRGGDVVGPMRHDAPGSRHPWQTLTHCWTKGGAIFAEEKDHVMDLISEVYVSDTPPDKPKSSMLKPQEWRRLKPIEPSPEAKTLRDEFAMALMDADDFMVGFKEHAEQLYRAADAMMEARKK